ncbi:MAG TPA: ammonium transporter [Methylomirabilota bacterium]|jgi:Amt family ammonium transporter|nr:ammonium transporter [Methylomirabilota bacterium]
MAIRSTATGLLVLVLALGLAAQVLAQAPTTSAPGAPATVAPAPAAAPSPAAAKIDSGDTAWVLVSAALVLLMTAPGLALFYGGMVRQKNALGTLMQSFIVLALISLQWVLWGYSLAFGPDKGGIIGGLEWFGLRGVGGAPNPDYAATIPHQAFMLFQMMFAVITPALITGAFAERKKFSTFIVFILAWATLVYDPLAHWVWGTGGWLRERGALDFAGGTVVHISSGISALAAALVIGKRRGYGHQPMPPHNLPMTVMGASLLWFGWFGFNAGSALAANALAAHAFTTTNTATAAAALGWMLTEWSSRGKPTVLGAASGAVAGLVAITPAAGFVTPMAAIIIGALAGLLCYTACNLKTKLGYDDSLDVVGVHGVGGTWGALATGLFATKMVNEAGGDGLFYGNPKQLGIQVMAVLVTWVLGFVMTTVILKVLDAIMGLRVTEDDEMAGLDLSQHSETAYVLGGSSYGEYSVGVGSGAFAEAMRAAEAKARSTN